jgi:hypothetical protein
MPAHAGIHAFAAGEDVDGRDKPGHDEMGVIARSEATKQSPPRVMRQ